MVLGSSKTTTTTQTMATQSQGPVVEAYTPHTNATVTYAAPEGSILLQQLTLGQNVLAQLMAGEISILKQGKGPSLKRRSPKRRHGLELNHSRSRRPYHPQSMTLGEGAAIEIISANTLHLEALQRDINALGRRITKPADVPPYFKNFKNTTNKTIIR